jgi:DNA-binding beta-propeller fold protein YncE
MVTQGIQIHTFAMFMAIVCATLVFCGNASATPYVHFRSIGPVVDAVQVGFDSAGYTYVADQGNHQVDGYDNTELFSFAAALYMATGPSGIAVNSSDLIYVSDDETHMIRVYGTDGTLQFQFGSPGNALGQLGRPRTLAIDKSDNVYVVEHGNSRVQVFDKTGNAIQVIGGPGTGPGQFSGPAGIALDDNGKLYVSDPGNSRIQVFESLENNLLFESTIGEGILQIPEGIAIDENGFILVADDGRKDVAIFNQSGTFWESFGTIGTGPGEFLQVRGAAIDSLGRLFISDGTEVEVFNIVPEPTGHFLVVCTLTIVGLWRPRRRLCLTGVD